MCRDHTARDPLIDRQALLERRLALTFDDSKDWRLNLNPTTGSLLLDRFRIREPRHVLFPHLARRSIKDKSAVATHL